MRRILASPVIARNEVKLTAYAKPPTLLDAPRIRGTLRAALLSVIHLCAYLRRDGRFGSYLLYRRLAFSSKIKTDANCKFDEFNF